MKKSAADQIRDHLRSLGALCCRTTRPFDRQYPIMEYWLAGGGPILLHEDHNGGVECFRPVCETIRLADEKAALTAYLRGLPRDEVDTTMPAALTPYHGGDA